MRRRSCRTGSLRVSSAPSGGGGSGTGRSLCRHRRRRSGSAQKSGSWLVIHDCTCHGLRSRARQIRHACDGEIGTPASAIRAAKASIVQRVAPSRRRPPPRRRPQDRRRRRRLAAPRSPRRPHRRPLLHAGRAAPRRRGRHGPRSGAGSSDRRPLSTQVSSATGHRGRVIAGASSHGTRAGAVDRCSMLLTSVTLRR